MSLLDRWNTIPVYIKDVFYILKHLIQFIYFRMLSLALCNPKVDINFQAEKRKLTGQCWKRADFSVTANLIYTLKKSETDNEFQNYGRNKHSCDVSFLFQLSFVFLIDEEHLLLMCDDGCEGAQSPPHSLKFHCITGGYCRRSLPTIVLKLL